MPSRSGQAATGLVMLSWGSVLIMILVIGTMLTFWAQERVVDQVLPADESVDWESGYLAVSIARHPIAPGGDTSIAAFIASPSYDRSTLRDRLAELRGRFVMDMERPSQLDILVVRDEQIICFEESGYCNSMQGLYRDNKDTFQETLSKRYDDAGGVSWVEIPGAYPSQLIVIIERGGS